MAGKLLHDAPNTAALAGAAHREIAQKPHFVFGLYNCVVVGKDGRVHLLLVCEWSPSVLDDVGVKEVPVRGEPSGQGSNSVCQ